MSWTRGIRSQDEKNNFRSQNSNCVPVLVASYGRRLLPPWNLLLRPKTKPNSINVSSISPKHSSSQTMLLRFISLLVFFATFSSTQIGLVNSHEESGEWSCDSDPETRVQAEYKPGIITLDGHADDWKYVDGFEFSLLPALDPDQENAYKGGKMTVKVFLTSTIIYLSVYICIHRCFLSGFWVCLHVRVRLVFCLSFSLYVGFEAFFLLKGCFCFWGLQVKNFIN